jgi:hypothetical protein
MLAECDISGIMALVEGSVLFISNNCKELPVLRCERVSLAIGGVAVSGSEGSTLADAADAAMMRVRKKEAGSRIKG